MSSDSWTVLKNEVLELVENPDLILNNTNVCVNGVCYWEVEEKDSSGKILCKLLKFNLGTEVFQLMDSPIPGTRYGRLMPLSNGRVALWDSTNYMNDDITTRDQCGIWGLNDGGNCWTKLINIDVPIGTKGMFGFWTHGTVFVESDESGQVLPYDPETGKFNEFQISPYTFYSYEESLVSVESINYKQCISLR
ncbi:hypothetical protein COLO4_23742 [Corchorus olitorius]|uniref:F-box associated beta-propeller type 1 domain-containing protein n=1 Tax=Corchorus olitorius TaxID=93759 RepID=A0A1R3IEV3_9ROSI|nr:hypothetical protein COLO4_23742 [Corchorus olitorius]